MAAVVFGVFVVIGGFFALMVSLLIDCSTDDAFRAELTTAWPWGRDLLATRFTARDLYYDGEISCNTNRFRMKVHSRAGSLA